MAHRNGELLVLQGCCKQDPESHRADFELQHAHYRALFDLFSLKPEQNSKELGDLVHFLAHVSTSYPEELKDFPQQLIDLLDKQSVVLHPSLRAQLVGSLILMRHKNFIKAQHLLPLCFRLFKCQDKQLRGTLHNFIINDIKGFNTNGKNERLNRIVQNYLYTLVNDDSELVAKRSLGVLTELWRRHIWRDVRTVNVIAQATLHPSPLIMLAALKFFLGQDAKDGEETEDKDPDVELPSGASKDDIYKAHHKGTPSTKKKKKRKLKRVQASVEKMKRRGQNNDIDSFAALQLLHDPQSFAERLMARCQQGHVRFDTRLVLMQVISRVIGVHELIFENFYPFLQRYLQPSQLEVTVVLACMVQACHKLVPPDVLQPVLKQIVDQFVHDKARPEVMTVGIKTVREMCLRCPLVMNEDLLGDLVLYKKYKDKHVSNAAKGLLGLFRELKPSMLLKKERGRGADLGLELQAYGHADIKDRVDGVELLEEAMRLGRHNEEDDEEADTDGESDDGDMDTEMASGDEDNDEAEGEDDDEDMEGSDDEDDEEEAAKAAKAKPVGVKRRRSARLAATNDDEDDDEDDDEAEEEEEDDGRPKKKVKAAASKQKPVTESLSQLKKRLVEKKTADRDAADAAAAAAVTVAPADAVPFEHEHVLTQEDFQRIKSLKVRKLVDQAMQKHGLKSATQRAKMKERLFEEMEEQVEDAEAQEGANQRRLDPSSLLSKKRGKSDKAERMASVMEGREDREKFGSSIARKSNKSGGSTNREKEKNKLVAFGAMRNQQANRMRKQKQKNNPKHQRGRASRGAWTGKS